MPYRESLGLLKAPRENPALYTYEELPYLNGLIQAKTKIHWHLVAIPNRIAKFTDGH